MEVGEAEIEKSVVPIPAKGTACGLSAALSVMVTAPVLFPAAEGVKVTFMRQVAPAATVLPLVQVVPDAREKSPLLVPVITTLVMFNVALPVLDRVTVCAALALPTG